MTTPVASTSTSTSSTSRQSHPPASKPPTEISPEAIISEKATLTGTHKISISANAIIHPFVRLDSSHGPISISSGVVIYERALIGARPPGVHNETREPRTIIEEHVVISSHTFVGCGARVRAFARVEPGARVGCYADIGEQTRVSPTAEVLDGETVESFMTVFVLNGRMARRENTAVKENGKLRELQALGLERENAVLRRVVKNGVAKWVS